MSMGLPKSEIEDMKLNKTAVKIAGITRGKVTVRRMNPLSLELRSLGPEPLTGTLIRALELLLERQAEAA